MSLLGAGLGYISNSTPLPTPIEKPLTWFWRVASLAFSPLILILYVYAVPEPTMAYLKRGYPRAAFRAMCSQRETPLQAARDLFHASILLQNDLIATLNDDMNDELSADTARLSRENKLWISAWGNRFHVLLVDHQNRRALVFVCILILAQYLYDL